MQQSDATALLLASSKSQLTKIDNSSRSPAEPPAVANAL